MDNNHNIYLQASKVATVAGSGFAIYGSLTWFDIAAIVGILTSIIGLVFMWYFYNDRRKREIEEQRRNEEYRKERLAIAKKEACDKST